jgi:hypothetical protein
VTGRATQDRGLMVTVELGSIADAHLLGRMRDDVPIDMFGCKWVAYKAAVSENRREVWLRRHDAGARQLMCWSCGSFNWDRNGPGDPIHCHDCGSHNIAGQP